MACSTGVIFQSQSSFTRPLDMVGFSSHLKCLYSSNLINNSLQTCVDFCYKRSSPSSLGNIKIHLGTYLITFRSRSF